MPWCTVLILWLQVDLWLDRLIIDLIQYTIRCALFRATKINKRECDKIDNEE